MIAHVLLHRVVNTRRIPSCAGKSSRSVRRLLRLLKGLIRGRSTITCAMSSRIARLRHARMTHSKCQRDHGDYRGTIVSNWDWQFACEDGALCARRNRKVKQLIASVPEQCAWQGALEMALEIRAAV
jgi:hypothetical protein